MIKNFLIENVFDWMCRPPLLWNISDILKICLEIIVLSCVQYIFIYLYRFIRTKIQNAKTTSKALKKDKTYKN